MLGLCDIIALPSFSVPLSLSLPVSRPEPGPLLIETPGGRGPDRRVLYIFWLYQLFANEWRLDVCDAAGDTCSGVTRPLSQPPIRASSPGGPHTGL